jgi:hypothetical protein
VAHVKALERVIVYLESHEWKLNMVNVIHGVFFFLFLSKILILTILNQDIHIWTLDCILSANISHAVQSLLTLYVRNCLKYESLQFFAAYLSLTGM